jgi:hypothetical protein
VGIIDELEITSQAANFSNQIFSLLTYCGSSIVKIQASFHMRRMVRVEVEVPVSVGGFPVGSVVPFLMTRTSRKGITLSDSISMVN